uniref:Protocadherin 2 alpha a 15 n=1 Tax=Myripristis murdjan TaxID=586833 RepID=A0A667X7T3_9TELE
STSVCLINLKSVLESPLEIHYIAVEVLDVNDHSPSFPDKDKRLEISESTLPGARFQLHAAIDPDGGVNSVQQYKLSPNNNFRLEVKDRGKDGKIPILHLQSPLDRETSSNHKLLLTAIDGGKPPKTGTVEIFINVLDVNDNMPVFTKDMYSAVLNENSPIGTTVVQVNATDLDEGPNGEVWYSFGNVNSKVRELFDVDPITGEITVKGLIDYEVDDIYEVDIQASDKGALPFKTDKSVTIEIIDMNDNEPEIEVTSLSGAISEDSRPGTTVALISITDLDSGLNGKVVSFVKGDVPFTLTHSIQDNMYAVVTKSELDRENKSNYHVTIVAKDTGKPTLTSEKTISIFVSDVNDNNPEFSQNPYTFYINENNAPGASVFSLRAFDRDDGENALIMYHIQKDERDHNKVTSFLNINSDNGDIFALRSFDCETLKTFQFQVVATDSGTPSLSSNVTVNVFILDQNDNSPVILYPVSANGSAEGVEEIPRNVNPGHLVTKVRAYDPDIGYNGWLLFSLQDVSDHSLFALDQNMYSLVTKILLDREKESAYDVTIVAKDAGVPSLSSQKAISIVISDVNDNSPEFSLSPYTFYVVENNSPGVVLFSVTASDRDEGDNSRISYHIMNNRSGDKPSLLLNINSENGDIMALSKFDFEKMKTFQFQVVATDSGTPSLSSNVTVNVFILDQNDNSPVILYPVSANGSAEGVEEIPRNVNAGHLVTKVRAYDPDIGYNGWLLFSLQEVRDHSLFGLDRYTGQLRTLRSFTETDEAEHKLVILVKDNGNVSLSATATVIVKAVEPKEAFAAADVKSATLFGIQKGAIYIFSLLYWSELDKKKKKSWLPGR